MVKTWFIGSGAGNSSAASALPPPTATPRTPASGASNFDLQFSALKIDSKPHLVAQTRSSSTTVTTGLPQSASMFVGTTTSSGIERPAAMTQTTAVAAPPHSQSFASAPSLATTTMTTTTTTTDWPNSSSKFCLGEGFQ